MPYNHLILCRPLLLLLLIFPSIWVFSSESAFHIRWTKYWSFGFSISPSNEYSRLISFRLDWFDLLAIQGTLKSLLQHHSLKASILWHSAFFMVQLSGLWLYPQCVHRRCLINLCWLNEWWTLKVWVLDPWCSSVFMHHFICVQYFTGEVGKGRQRDERARQACF